MLTRRGIIAGFLGGAGLLALPAAAGGGPARWLGSSRRLLDAQVEWRMELQGWAVVWWYEGFPGEPGPLVVATIMRKDQGAAAWAVSQRAPLRVSGGPRELSRIFQRVVEQEIELHLV